MDVYPRTNVCYRVQNLDLGPFLGLVDDMPIGRAGRKATLVVRPRKDGIKTQEWVFRDMGNGTWSIVNHALPFYVDDTATPSAAFSKPHSTPPGKVTLEQENDTNIIKIKIGGSFLTTTTGFDLALAPRDTDEDKIKWRLLEVNPILGQIGYKYRLRALNGRILNVDANGTSTAMILADSKQVSTNKTLFDITAAPDGKCTIQLISGGSNDYLSTTSKYVMGQPNWVIQQGTKFEWDINSIGGFAYQFTVKPGSTELALTVENDQDIILKPNKVGHGQLWLVERDYN